MFATAFNRRSGGFLFIVRMDAKRELLIHLREWIVPVISLDDVAVTCSGWMDGVKVMGLSSSELGA